MRKREKKESRLVSSRLVSSRFVSFRFAHHLRGMCKERASLRDDRPTDREREKERDQSPHIGDTHLTFVFAHSFFPRPVASRRVIGDFQDATHERFNKSSFETSPQTKRERERETERVCGFQSNVLRDVFQTSQSDAILNAPSHHEQQQTTLAFGGRRGVRSTIDGNQRYVWRESFTPLLLLVARAFKEALRILPVSSLPSSRWNLNVAVAVVVP